jgi:hypothetical protein
MRGDEEEKLIGLAIQRWIERPNTDLGGASLRGGKGFPQSKN